MSDDPRVVAGSRPPTRNDALPLYLQDYGLSLGKEGEQLLVKKKGEVVREVRLLDVSQVCLFGSVHTTEPALRELSTRGIPVCHFSYGGGFYALTTGLVQKNVELRIRQYATAADPNLALAHSRRFIAGKIRNFRTMLHRHLDDAAKPRLMWQLNEYIRKAEGRRAPEVPRSRCGTAMSPDRSSHNRPLRASGRPR
jgi:CRISPR-associated protein Cas1